MVLRHELLRALYKAPRFRGRDRLIGLVSKSFVEKPTRLRDGLTMLLDPSEWVQQDILVHGATEPGTLRLIAKLVAPGDAVIDVGAHVGHHALVAAKAAGPAGKVIAIDPQPYNADRVARNAQLNGMANVLTIIAAAGDKPGFIKLPIQSDRDRARLSLLEAGPGDTGALVEVPLRRIDEIIESAGLPAVKLIKIDVEGFELEVLLGLAATAAKCANIILEVLDTSMSDRNGKIARFLTDAGFALRTIEGAAWKPGEPLPEQNLWAARS